MKVKDTDSTDTKFQLLNLDAGIGYNFAADSSTFPRSGLTTERRSASILTLAAAHHLIFINMLRASEGLTDFYGMRKRELLS